MKWKLLLYVNLWTFVIFNGCAQLKVQVDVYSDDPLLESLSDPKRLEATRNLIQRTKTVADNIVLTRKKIAEDMNNLEVKYLELMAKLNKFDSNNTDISIEIEDRRVAKTEYVEEIEKRGGAVMQQAERAMEALKHFAQVADKEISDGPISAARFLDAIETLEMQMTALAKTLDRLTTRNLGTHFEEVKETTLEYMPEELEETLDALERKKGKFTPAEQKKFKKVILEMSDFLDTIAANQEEVELLRKSAESIDFDRVGAALTSAYKAVYDKTTHPRYQEKEQLIRDISISMDFLTSQLDRIQDPADPVWRILSDPDNQHKWHTHFARAKFYAEGDAEVVFVQDRIGHFRPQRGQNNPAALIQGQVRINRTIASGVLDVLAAAGGVSGLAGQSKVKESLVNGDELNGKEKKNDTEADVNAKIRMKEKSEGAAKARRTLLNRLRVIRERVANSPKNQDIDAETYEQLKQILSVYQRFLKSSEGDKSCPIK